MIEYCLIIIMQILYIIAKFVGTRNVFQTSLKRRIVVANLANFIWLISTTLGVGIMLKGDYLVVIPYLVGVTLGVIVEDKLRKYF